MFIGISAFSWSFQLTVLFPCKKENTVMQNGILIDTHSHMYSELTI